MRMSLLLIDDNPGNLAIFVHWRTFRLELQQQATNSIGQCHEIALVVKLHKNPTQNEYIHTFMRTSFFKPFDTDPREVLGLFSANTV